ncbi:polyamine-transporting ATPase 13A3-like [Ischnura elegans]|uniref:polyamine-transporting ATPase 13A3-like n=1 Tax=Ischnura elegans TaxID=197161 RepID=UPI001ED8B0E6|nr:polyamine-transporting ATPase 13A3-like [Ischnura elegans]XP_046387713.1 polyamine-transporting ATPase 13A3-like [Ischnura elegans]
MLDSAALPIRRLPYEPIQGDDFQVIDSGESGKLECYSYKYSCCRTFLYYIVSILLLGIPLLIAHWYKQWKVYAQCRRCALSKANVMLVKDSRGQYEACKVHDDNEYLGVPVRYFSYHLVRYVWKPEIQFYQKLHGFQWDNGEPKTLTELLDDSRGHTSEEQEALLNVFGENVIEVEVKSYARLFLEEIFHPFYLFQIGSVTLWALDEYYYYAGCVIFISSLSLIVSLLETRRQSIMLREMVTSSQVATVAVCRKNGGCEEVPVSKLVPGDLIAIPENGCSMPCDAVLVAGNCIVNESMLTGESVPVTKTPPTHSEEPYEPENHKRHTLFCGTQVIQPRYYGSDKVLAVVTRTGYATAKGELVKSILFPQPLAFKLYEDSMKFILVLFCIAAIGMTYCIRLFLARGADTETIILRTLDIITIVVPPALPAAMTVGTVYSQSRLREQGIFCISPPRINVCGKIKLVCFDKTGTLTEEGLSLWGVLEVKSGSFSYPFLAQTRDSPGSDLDPFSPLTVALAACHSLTQVQGELTGDPLDLRMFEATGWELEEVARDTARFDLLVPTVVRPRKPIYKPGPIDPALGESIRYEVGILKHFPFSSGAQRMSVITRTLGDRNMHLFCKGAPERVLSICLPHTVPPNFHEVLMDYTSWGYRVLSLAYKPFERKFSWHHAQKAKRDQMEKDLIFLGFLIMENKLKPESTPVIHELKDASIRCVMVTGDNVLTAISVSRECGIIGPGESVMLLKGIPPDTMSPPQLKYEYVNPPNAPVENRESNDSSSAFINLSAVDKPIHLAVEGPTWSFIHTHFPDLVSEIVLRATVLARMAPDQKAQLVLALQKLDYIVAMCGDGANDCGALKAAHIGISLSEAEASVAAPFTSKVPNVTCVPAVVREGRCALVTSFAVFKYMALYSMVQFISVLILYSHKTNLGNTQFLYIDLVVTTSLAVSMGRTSPVQGQLVKARPTSTLASAATIIPVLLQTALAACAQYGAILFLSTQKWFQPVVPAVGQEIVICWENTVVFCVSSFQYLILATVYSKGKPHRKPLYTNTWLLFSILILTFSTTLLTLFPLEPVASFFELEKFSGEMQEMYFRFYLLGLPLMNLLLAVFVEKFIAGSTWMKKIIHFVSRKKKPKNKYKNMNEMNFAWLNGIQC